MLRGILNPAVHSLQFKDRFTMNKLPGRMTVKANCLAKLPEYVTVELVKGPLPQVECPSGPTPAVSLGYFPHAFVTSKYVPTVFTSKESPLTNVPVYSLAPVTYYSLLKRAGRSEKLRFVTDSFYEITARCCRPQEG